MHPPMPLAPFSPVETQPCADLQGLQLEKLKAQLAYPAGRATFYQRRLAAAGVALADFPRSSTGKIQRHELEKRLA